MLRPLASVVAKSEAQASRAEDDREDDEPELDAAQPKEHVVTPIVSAAKRGPSLVARDRELPTDG